MFKYQMRKSFNSKRPDFRKMEPETAEEFLARGGKIKKIPRPSLLEISAKWSSANYMSDKEALKKEKEQDVSANLRGKDTQL